MKRITSAANPDYKRWLKLMQSARERRTAGMSLLDGVHLVQVYREQIGVPEALAISESAEQNPEISRLIRKLGVSSPLLLSDALFANLSSVATPTGIIAAVRTPRPGAPPRSPGPSVWLEDIQDPGNLGSILRTAAAAGIREVYLSRGCVHCWSPRVLRAGMGAHFMLELFEGTDLTLLAGSYSGRVLATQGVDGTPVYDADLTGNVALLFGNEGAGVSAGLRRAIKEHVTIPMPGGTESLNVAAAVAVCLFERVRQTRLLSRTHA